MTSTGIAAPPETQTRSEDVSASSRVGGVEHRGVHRRDALEHVTLSRAMISSALAGSKRGSSVRHAPRATAAFSPQVCPKEWNSGSAPRIDVLLGELEQRRRRTSALRRRLSCVSSAPFGVPVVPDV